MSLKENNEITLKINTSVEKFIDILKLKGYKHKENFTMMDSYFIPQSLDVKALNVREILSYAILIRDIITNNEHRRMLTRKYKNIDEAGNILEQSSINCEVKNIEDAKKFIASIGYSEIMEIYEEDVVYAKDGFEIAIKNVKGGDNLIEIETDEKYDSIEKLKAKILEEDLPVNFENLFVKKAEAELEKILK